MSHILAIDLGKFNSVFCWHNASAGEVVFRTAKTTPAVMRYGVEYQKRSEQEFEIDHRKRLERSLHRRAREMGYTLTKIEPPAEPQPA